MDPNPGSKLRHGVRAAGPRKGWRCIDVCGAPGGKSLYLADLLEGTGMVEVRDISQRKADLIQENVRRLGMPM